MRLTKNTKTLIFSAAGLAVLIAVTLILVLLPDNEPETEQNPAVTDNEASEYPRFLTEFEVTDVVRVTVRNPSDEYVIEREGTHSFIMPVLSGIPVNANRLEGAARNAARFRLQALVEEDADDLEQYGLADTAALVTAEFENGEVLEVYIGDPTPTADNTSYVRIAGENTVYTVFSSAVHSFREDRRYFVSLTLTESHENLGMPLTDKLIIDHTGGETYVIELIPPVGDDDVSTTMSLHRMITPYQVDLSLTESYSLLYGMFGLVASGVAYVGDEIPDKGEVAAVIEMTVGLKTVNLELRTSLEYAADDTGLAGNTLMFYGVYSEIPNVLYTFEPSVLPWLSVNTEQIMAQFFHTPLIFTVSDLIVEAAGHELHFTLTGDQNDNNEVYFMDGMVIDERNFKLLYQFAISAPSEAPFRGNADEVRGMPLMARYTFRYRGGMRDDDVIEFRDSGDFRMVVTRNGVPLFSSRTAYLTRLEQNVELILNGGTIILGW